MSFPKIARDFPNWGEPHTVVVAHDSDVVRQQWESILSLEWMPTDESDCGTVVALRSVARKDCLHHVACSMASRVESAEEREGRLRRRRE